MTKRGLPATMRGNHTLAPSPGPTMNPIDLPPFWHSVIASLSLALDARNAWRLPFLLAGLLFARPRRTLASCLRAVGVHDHQQPYYHFLRVLGLRSEILASFLTRHVACVALPDGPARFAIDDTPTPRYGPHVQGAGVHHNPTPGPAGSPYLFGHVWVTLAAVPRHPDWGVIALPLHAHLYVREKDIPHPPAAHARPFRTKLDMAAELITGLKSGTALAHRPVQVAVDGAYVTRTVLRAAKAVGVVVVGRLRKDAALRGVPVPTPGKRGRPRIHGTDSLSLASLASVVSGWEEVECFRYGRVRRKRVKSFVATWAVAGGGVRVVIVDEPNGWRAYISTDPEMGAVEVLEVAAARTGIEDGFKNLKVEGGAGEQQAGISALSGYHPRPAANRRVRRTPHRTGRLSVSACFERISPK